ncbi:hypothetical protein [Lentzea albidocapillata]|nr:hypothetical protein [Lentzea albidocapillata]
MLSRAVVGVVTGAVAGFGFPYTMTLMIRYCNGGPSRSLCRHVLLLIPLQFLFWVAVAGMLVVAGFRFLRQRRGRWVVGVAPVLWVVLVLATLHVIHEYFDLYQAERAPLITTVVVVTGCVAYAVAALCVGRSPGSARAGGRTAVAGAGGDALASVVTAGYGGRCDGAEHRGQDG